MSTVVEALKADENQGKMALESMVELTNSHPEIWKGNASQLVNVISQVMTNKDFDNGTRAAATEVVAALSEQMPATLRKTEEIKTMFFPALAQMLMEVEEDESTWADMTDVEEEMSKNPSSTAVSVIGRLSNDLGEKTTLAACQPLISEFTKSENWVQRQAGFIMLGLIAEACKESMLKNMEEAMKMACSGIVDTNVRVRYAGLSATALLLTELAPKAQNKFHADLMPVLLKMMNSEELIKMQTQATSATFNFTKGYLTQEDDDEEQQTSKVMALYSKDLLVSLAALLQKGIQKNYEPL